MGFWGVSVRCAEYMGFMLRVYNLQGLGSADVA